ncbi:hypothetical protein HVA01_28310 [Halovibrio variabilis]|uniref:Uncharacterized protein n=1 Tax=Halovibrio variabilis TaxID=31910 RepID=A0A511URH6_9GAMM|nr:hypothetical protein HVA01_28310 [Halovibrio variabilis]
MNLSGANSNEIGAKYAPFGMNALFSAAIYDLTKNDVTIGVVQGNGVIEQYVVGQPRRTIKIRAEKLPQK